MLKILYELYSTRDMIALYTDYNDMSKFHFGVVIAINEKEIAIQKVSPDGEDDGIIVMDVDNVIRVELNSQYAEKMKKLCSSKTVFLYNTSIKNDYIKRSALSFVSNENNVTSIELLDSGYNDIIGFVVEIDNEECKIKQVDEYGCLDGFSYIYVKDITKISFLTQNEKRIAKLIELENKQGNAGDG